MFKPAHLRKAFFALLVLGIVRGSERLVTFFYFPDTSMFSISVPQLLAGLLRSFLPAVLAYILYWFAKRKYGEEPKEEKKPKAEDENLISDEKLTKIIYAIIIAVSILWVLWSILFRK